MINYTFEGLGGNVNPFSGILSRLTKEEEIIAERDYMEALNELKECKVSVYDQFANNLDTFKSEHPKIWKNAKIFGIPFGLFCVSVAALSALNNYVVDTVLDQDNTYTVSASNNNSSPYITICNGTDTFDLSVYHRGIFMVCYMSFDLTNNTIVNEICDGKEEIDVYLDFGDSEFTPIYVDKVEHSDKIYNVSVNCKQKKLILTGV